MFSSIFNFSSSIEKGSSYVLVYLINSIFSFNNDILSNILFLNFILIISLALLIIFIILPYSLISEVAVLGPIL